jgi:hypothetical protein
MNVLIFGGGSKWGQHFTQHILAQGHSVDLVTSSDSHGTNNIKVDWMQLTLEGLEVALSPLKGKQYDFIFFNQNSGGAPNDVWFEPTNTFPLQAWNQHTWVDCQLPYYAIKFLTNSIHKDTKVGWMLTGLIDGKEKDKWKYAGYASHKTTNIHLMRGFSQYHPGIFFCVNPSWFPPGQEAADADSIFKLVNKLTAMDSGRVFNKDGREWLHYSHR